MAIIDYVQYILMMKMQSFYVKSYTTLKLNGRPVIPYSPDSINNSYGGYGSQYPNDLYNNPYATDPPRIMHDKSRGVDRRDVYDYCLPGYKIILKCY